MRVTPDFQVMIRKMHRHFVRYADNMDMRQAIQSAAPPDRVRGNRIMISRQNDNLPRRVAQDCGGSRDDRFGLAVAVEYVANQQRVIRPMLLRRLQHRAQARRAMMRAVVEMQVGAMHNYDV